MSQLKEGFLVDAFLVELLGVFSSPSVLVLFLYFPMLFSENNVFSSFSLASRSVECSHHFHKTNAPLASAKVQSAQALGTVWFVTLFSSNVTLAFPEQRQYSIKQRRVWFGLPPSVFL